MKKTKRYSRARQNENDERFAGKVISQIIISILVFIAVFVNSKLSNPVSGQINDYIRHYLCTSFDFDKAVNTAKAYFDNLMNSRESVPVNTVDDIDLKEDNY